MIREHNLNLLLKQNESSQKVWAIQAGVVPAHLTQMKNGHRAMGGNIARRIETNLNLPIGWMDKHRVNINQDRERKEVHDVSVMTLTEYCEYLGVDHITHDNGVMNMETVPQLWLENHGYDITKLFRMALGVSNLRPLYLETDTVVINTEFDGRFEDKGVYAFGKVGGSMTFSIAYTRTSGGISLADGAESSRPDEAITASEVGNLQVIGKLVRFTRDM